MNGSSGIRVLLVASMALIGLVGFSAQAQASFGPIATVGTDAVPAGIATADLNLDGNADVVVSVRSSNKVQVFLGDGSGGFTQVAPITTSNLPSSVARVTSTGTITPTS